MIVRLDARLKPPAEVIRSLGVDKGGEVQAFFTGRVLFHMRQFMPWLTGQTATGLTQAASATQIVVNAPYARYLYMGKKMRDPNGGGPFPILDPNGEFQGEFRYRKGAHPVATEEDLEYTHTANPDAGPFWDRTLAQQRGAQIIAETQEFARRSM